VGSEKHGIGKDSYLSPVKMAVGPWNFTDISARQALDVEHNRFLRSTILRVNEAHDLGDKRFQFYDQTKDWFASPPETLRIADKWLGAHPIFNLVGVIISTNHLSDGLYLPLEDRRYYVAWSKRAPDDFKPGYWRELWDWYAAGGLQHAAAYLATLDLSGFDPFAPPLHTEAWWTIVNANQTAEESELADVLDWMGQDPTADSKPSWPDAVTIRQLAAVALRIGADDLYAMLTGGARASRAIPHKLGSVGYSPVRNEGDKQGMWKIAGKRTVIYAKEALSRRDRYNAARDLKKWLDGAAGRARVRKAREKARQNSGQAKT
jgi:hypothetical protein